MTGIFVPTASYRIVSLTSPEPATIDIRDIASGLAKINRFAGATMVPYSVAQHSCLVVRILEHDRRPAMTVLHGLLHDGHEAYVGDLSRPAQAAVAGAAPWYALTRRLDLAIWQRLGIDPPDEEAQDLIALADNQALATEWRDLFPGAQGPALGCTAVQPARWHVKPMPWHRAEEQFLAEFERLAIAAGITVPT